MHAKKQIILMHKAFYRIILLAVFLSVLGIGNLSPVHAQTWTSTHQITYFQGNKPGAVSFTFDDGLASQAGNGASQLNARGLKGTFFVITSRGEVPWATWRSLAAQGHEIASHTVSHQSLPTLSVSAITWELSESQSIINRNVFNQSCITIAYPSTETNNTVQAIADDYYVAARGGWMAGYPNYYQAGQDQYGSWNTIDFTNVGSMLGDNLDINNWSFNRALDNAAQRHAWYDIHFHDITNASAFGNVLDYIQGKDAYWIDTFSNVARYMKERLNSTVQVITDTPSVIRLRIIMDGSLSTSLYNVPLTIRSTVPVSWAQVIVQQGSNIQTFTPVIEGSDKVVYYNALPSGGDIILTPSNPLPNPIPGLTSLSPTSVFAGGSAFTLTVTGTNFVNGSIVRWNNSERATTYVSGTQLRVSIPASDIASVGMANVRVFNPTPGGGVSNQLPFTITPKPITVTVDPNQSKTYGDADPIFTYTSSDPAATFTGSLSREPGENVGAYAINQGTLAVVGSNYTIASFVPANFIINKSIATVTLSNLGHLYDGTQKSALATTDPPDLRVDITYNGSSTVPSDAGTYTVIATVNHPDYAGVANDILIITQVIVDPAITASNKTYDGTTGATIATRSLVGVIGTDVVSLSGGTAAFVDKNIGNGKSVTATGLGLSGADAGNYQLSSTSANTVADISPRTLTVTATGVNKIYDGTTAASVTLSDDRVGGDDLTTNYTAASFPDPNVGSDKTVNVSGIRITGGADIGNYTLGNTTAITTADITIAGQTITVTKSAPATASDGSNFNVAATATSGLPVAITTSGVCTGQGSGTATVTMTSGFGICSVLYNQAGNMNHSVAGTIQEDVKATQKPSITSANKTTFDIGFAGTFTVTTTGNPATPMIISASGTLPDGVTFVDNNDGTATLSGISTAVGTYPLAITADNDILPNAAQSFTLTVRNGPIIDGIGINSLSDSSHDGIRENEVIPDTLGITRITVEFTQDVNNPDLDIDLKDVTNPANYILVLGSSAGTFQTVSCSEGLVAPDVSIAIDSVTYSNGGGSGPFIATLKINGGFPLNVTGYYRLYVCGTTSIVDATNVGLELAGDGVNPGTDFLRNFRIQTLVRSGGDGSAAKGPNISSLQIPVTGFAPGWVTRLPTQPADKVYRSLGELRIEIPTLGIDFPIVGAAITRDGWDLTWLQNNVAYLEGSAYPTLAGNTVLTAHVTDANNNLGPFSDIKGMQLGQKIYIHVNGQVHVYQVQENKKVLPSNILAAFKHEEYSWITLVTCEDYNARTGLYKYRRMVRAVLISVIPEK